MYRRLLILPVICLLTMFGRQDLSANYQHAGSRMTTSSQQSVSSNHASDGLIVSQQGGSQPTHAFGSTSPIGYKSSSATLHQYGGGGGGGAAATSGKSGSYGGLGGGSVSFSAPLSPVGAMSAPQLSEVGQPSNNRPKRIGGGGNYNDDDDPDEPGDNPDPFPTPLGNLPFVILILFAGVYGVWNLKGEKKKGDKR